MRTIRIFLINPNLLVRTGIKAFLETDVSMKVVGEAGDLETALGPLMLERPDLILVNADETNGSSAVLMIDELAEASPLSRLLILTGDEVRDTHKAVMLAGASGLMSKNQTPETLIWAIRKIFESDAWTLRTLSSRLLAGTRNRARTGQRETDRTTSLTQCEREIAALISEGLVNKDIANRLFISEKTVRNHLTTVYSKLNLTSRVELAVHAADQGLLVG